MVGTEATAFWVNQPRVDPQTMDVYFPGAPDALSTGGRIGALLFDDPLHSKPNTLWPPLFELRQDDTVVFAADEDCIPTPPTLNRLSLSDFRHELNVIAETPQQVAAAAEFRHSVGMGLPDETRTEKYFASRCRALDAVDPPPPEDPEDVGELPD